MIDDDTDLTSLLADYFLGFGHKLLAMPDAAMGMQALRRQQPDLLILDIMLPDKDGLTLCKEIREKFDVPILMLTARGELTDKVLGLELGADDYLAKPFEPRELVARIGSIIRRSSSSFSNKTLEADGLRLETETHQVTLDGRELNLTSMEFQLLLTLMESRGKILSRNQLLDRLRGIETEVYDRSVDMLVSRLRDKLGDSSKDPRFIRTIRSSGYKFVGKAS
jgi:DNA-binding response OmpR family regulator